MSYYDDRDQSQDQKTRREARNKGEELRDKINEAIGGTSARGWATKQELKEKLGICHDCTNLEYTRTEYGRIFAFCGRNYENPIRLSGNERVVECTQYYAKHQMGLSDMASMATLIDIDKKTVKGFIDK